LDAADAVFAARGGCYSAVELLQEALERYLKGFLIGKGWPLQRIHNLSTLLDAAVINASEIGLEIQARRHQ